MERHLWLIFAFCFFVIGVLFVAFGSDPIEYVSGALSFTFCVENTLKYFNWRNPKI